MGAALDPSPLILFHGVELAANHGQLPHREKGQSARERSYEERKSVARWFPPTWMPSYIFRLNFLKLFCLYAGGAIFVLSLIFMSIHDRYGLAFPTFTIGLGLMIFAGFLTAFDRRAENVVIEAVIVAELEFGDIGKVLGTDLVERANDTALEDAPEAFNPSAVW
jgi:hypothetical protein